LGYWARKKGARACKAVGEQGSIIKFLRCEKGKKSNNPVGLISKPPDPHGDVTTTCLFNRKTAQGIRRSRIQDVAEEERRREEICGNTLLWVWGVKKPAPKTNGDEASLTLPSRSGSDEK